MKFGAKDLFVFGSSLLSVKRGSLVRDKGVVP